jgi:phenylalanyl-tRNA synthetase alpha chain
MSASVLSADDLRRALSVRDLTDPSAGPHAMQRLVGDVVRALHHAWRAPVIVHRASPVVDVADNYDRLRYPEGGAARDARYTRYITPRAILRTQTSAMVPPLLRLLGAAGAGDVALACPGLVYRRDAIDRLHTGEPHQIDLWRVRAGERLTTSDLCAMIDVVVDALLPGAEHRTLPAVHPYTTDGLQIDVRDGDTWIEIGECGLAHPALLLDCGIDPDGTSGLAMGLGLDRVVMLRKGIDDIRLLRSRDPRVAIQMLDLARYTPVSMQPPVRRDLSIAVDEGAVAEELGDRVRSALGAQASSVEEIAILSETPYDALPSAAALRLGMRAGQKNVLLRVVLRDPERTLTHEEANLLRDAIYEALHEGSVYAWASAGRRVRA